MRIDVTLSSTPENYPRDLCGEHCVSLYPPWISSTKGFKDRFILVEVEEDRAAILLQPYPYGGGAFSSHTRSP
jgi:hypothetical protein